MNKIVVSVGVFALGASAMHAAPAGMGMVDPAKSWSVSATLRGFYDDNYVTAPKGSERDSFGASISPTVAYGVELDQSTIALKYTYGATWYEDRTQQSSDNNPWDQSHQLDAIFNHAFSERYKLDVKDSFVSSVEPELLASVGAGIPDSPYRTQQNSLRNYGEFSFEAALSRQLSLVLGYSNTYVDYQDDGGAGSLSAQLDRMEHLPLVNLRWQTQPDTTLVLGYQYGQRDYLDNEAIFLGGPDSDYRNSRSHYVYGGVDQNFSKDLVLSLRGGAQWTDYYNDPTTSNEVSPYGNVELTYSYKPGSTVQMGYLYRQSASESLGSSLAEGVNLDQQVSYLYAAVNHRFDAKWAGRLMGSWQNSTYNGGLYDGQTEDFFGAGVNLSYQFNRNFSGEVGYNYDLLSSELPNRDYDRNRVYVGVTAAY